MCFLCSHSRRSTVSVVFDFSASLKDVAPVSPIMLPVDLMHNGKRVNFGGLHACVFCVHSPDRVP